MPVGEPVRFPLFLTSDTTDPPSDGLESYTRAEASLPLPAQNLENCRGSRSAPAAQPTGCKLQAATADLNGLHVAGLHPTKTNEPTLRRVSDLPGGARLNHLLNRSTHHETVVHLLRSRRSIRCSVRANCYRVAPTELHSQRHSGIRPGGALKWH